MKCRFDHTTVIEDYPHPKAKVKYPKEVPVTGRHWHEKICPDHAAAGKTKVDDPLLNLHKPRTPKKRSTAEWVPRWEQLWNKAPHATPPTSPPEGTIIYPAGMSNHGRMLYREGIRRTSAAA